MLALRNSEQRMNQHKEKKQEGNKESREKVSHSRSDTLAQGGTVQQLLPVL